MGKAYANKRGAGNKPKIHEGDYYSTPKSLVWVMKDIIKREIHDSNCILEPACGELAISSALSEMGCWVRHFDLKRDSIDYLTHDFHNYKYVITNPPFSLWDEFVERAKTHCTKFMFIGRLNYLGTHSRNVKGIWNNLKAIYAFDRYVDYQTPYRDDGMFHVGAMATGWFLWDMEYTSPPIIQVIDIQKYATLGNFKG